MSSALTVEELDAATLQALAASQMDRRHDRLNALLDRALPLPDPEAEMGL